MFSKYITTVEENIQSANFKTLKKEVREILKKARNGKDLSFEELGSLLSIDPEKDVDLFMEILAISRQIKERMFKNRIFPIVPVYVSSFCIEHCKYCNYRAENKDKAIKRVRLTLEQLQEELEYLILKKHFRVIELVYGSDPKIFPKIPDHIKLAHKILDKKGGGMVSINAGPFTVEDYRAFKEAGLDFVVLWQETYQKEYYDLMHPGDTQKADFCYRVDDFERALQAGIKNIGLGVLLGLAPWRKDWLLLMEHERYLFNKYGVRTSIVGIPRLKPAIGALIRSTSFIPSDKELQLAVAVHNIFSPETLPFVNTREKFELCIELSKGGGVLFTFNCSTIPGGYTLGEKGYQFPTYDFDVDEYLPKIRAKGLEPVFNWYFDKEHVPAVCYE